MAAENFRQNNFSSIGDSVTIVVTTEWTYAHFSSDNGNGNECSTKKFSFDTPENNALAALPSDGDNQVGQICELSNDENNFADTKPFFLLRIQLIDSVSLGPL